MAYESNLTSLSFPTVVDLSAAQYKAVAVDSTGNLVIATAAKNADGILQNNPTANDTGAVAISGISKCKLGGTVAVGDLVEVGAAGVIIKTVSGNVIGKALEAGAIGNIVSVLLKQSNAVFA